MKTWVSCAIVFALMLVYAEARAHRTRQSHKAVVEFLSERMTEHNAEVKDRYQEYEQTLTSWREEALKRDKEWAEVAEKMKDEIDRLQAEIRVYERHPELAKPRQ